jgi:predicted kinase
MGRLTLTLCKGLPASGKSSWAKEQVALDPETVVVTKDDIRDMLHIKDWNYDKEKEVVRRRDFLIAQALSKGRNTISCDTNLAPKHEAALRQIAKRYKAVFEVKSFLDVPLEECIRRDSLRENSVGEKVIRDMAEGVPFILGPEYLVPGRRSPQLFVDLDGVLADFDGFVKKEFGIENNRENERPDFWEILRGYRGRLYYDMAPLDGARAFWEALKPYDPIILTGIPWSIEGAVKDKRDWVSQYIDPGARVVPCRSRSKSKYGVKGDILIDDWKKYEDKWVDMGGVFVHYKGDRKATLREVRDLLDRKG